jgi:hypothetical protein
MGYGIYLVFGMASEMEMIGFKICIFGSYRAVMGE